MRKLQRQLTETLRQIAASQIPAQPAVKLPDDLVAELRAAYPNGVTYVRPNFMTVVELEATVNER